MVASETSLNESAEVVRKHWHPVLGEMPLLGSTYVGWYNGIQRVSAMEILPKGFKVL